MDKAIRDFPKQFEWVPEVQNSNKLGRYNKFIICGMGGSHLAGGIIKAVKPETDITIHSDYDLPKWPKERFDGALVIASSYSGNTEETISAFEAAIKAGIPAAAISIGGKLLDLALDNHAPFVQMPNTGIEPRSALGFSLRSMLALMLDERSLRDTVELSKALNIDKYEIDGKEFAVELKNKTPVIYASTKNLPIAYNWKIKFNETGKVPAFYNVFPELNHNEMVSFDVSETTRLLTENLHFIIIRDPADHPRILKRMEVMRKLFHDRGLAVSVLLLEEGELYYKVFSSLVLADWTAYYTSLGYGMDPQEVALIEEFKKMIA
ncbi:MAG: SIS domain-containing protein [Patescibacteria group bacterium]